MTKQKQRVVVLGASPKPERYSNRALRLLREQGHEVVPVHPAALSIEGLPVIQRLEEVAGPVNTVTLYVSPEKSSALEAEIIGLAPERVIFNPGSENPALQERLASQGIRTQQACTLVLLNTHQF